MHWVTFLLVNHTGKAMVVNDQINEMNIVVHEVITETDGLGMIAGGKGQRIVLGGHESAIVLPFHKHDDGSICGWNTFPIFKETAIKKGHKYRIYIRANYWAYINDLEEKKNIRIRIDEVVTAE
jgi:hypothetical protein